MKIFLTGGTGFIGSHLINHLSKTNHTITAIRRKNSKPSIKLLKEPCWIEKSLHEIVSEDLSGQDILIHLAAAGVSPKKARWDEMININVIMTLNLLQLSQKVSIKRIIISGSYAEYGLSSESYDFIPVNSTLKPTTPYASSKAASFITSNTFAIKNNLELCYLRIFSAYGNGQFENNFWTSLKKAAYEGKDFLMTEGNQIRDFIKVEDVAKLILLSAERNDIVAGKPMVLNIGSGNPISLKDFAKYWWKKWNAKGKLKIGALPYRKNEIMRFVPLINIKKKNEKKI